SLALGLGAGTSSGSGVAISPDGQTLAFVATSSTGPQLYIRRLDEWEARSVPGTYLAMTPFFSPDGKWIAYQQGRKLFKMPARGGAPQLVSALNSQYQGASWKRADEIILAGWPEGVRRISVDVGASEILARGDDGGTWYLWPERLPDDAGVLFTVWR